MSAVWYCSHYLPSVLVPVMNLDLRISLSIFFFFNWIDPNVIFRGLGEDDSWKNLKQKISWHCPFKGLAHQILDRTESGLRYHEINSTYIQYSYREETAATLYSHPKYCIACVLNPKIPCYTGRDLQVATPLEKVKVGLKSGNRGSKLCVSFCKFPYSHPGV